MEHDYDHYYMKLALHQAQKAYDRDEVPIGALVVDSAGNILGRGYNCVEKKHTQNAHAEIIALAKAGKKGGDWRLDGCSLYVTLEPCAMCMGLIRLSRLKRIIFGAPSKFFSYQLDKSAQGPLYSKDIAVLEGVMADQAAGILKTFFKQKRMNRD